MHRCTGGHGISKMKLKAALPFTKGDIILVMTKLKGFADNKLDLANMAFSLFDRVQNTERKGENAG